MNKAEQEKKREMWVKIFTYYIGARKRKILSYADCGELLNLIKRK